MATVVFPYSPRDLASSERGDQLNPVTGLRVLSQKEKQRPQLHVNQFNLPAENLGHHCFELETQLQHSAVLTTFEPSSPHRSVSRGQ